MTTGVIDAPALARGQGGYLGTITRSIWLPYGVRWQFLTKLCGSVPNNPEMIAAWLKARSPVAKPSVGLSMQEMSEEVLGSLEEQEELPEFSELCFQQHAGGCVMRIGTVRAHMKDAARILSSIFFKGIKPQGEPAFSTLVLNGVYPDERQYWIPIRRLDGSLVTSPDGSMDKPVHVRGPRGEPLSALKRIEYIEPPSYMEFTLKVLKRLTRVKDGETMRIVAVPCVHEDDLHSLMEYGGTHGYAGERSDGEGRYEFTIQRLDSAVEGRAASDD